MQSLSWVWAHAFHLFLYSADPDSWVRGLTLTLTPEESVSCLPSLTITGWPECQIVLPVHTVWCQSCFLTEPGSVMPGRVYIPFCFLLAWAPPSVKTVATTHSLVRLMKKPLVKSSLPLESVTANLQSLKLVLFLDPRTRLAGCMAHMILVVYIVLQRLLTHPCGTPSILTLLEAILGSRMAASGRCGTW